jgi:hypothetical protein
MGVKCSKAFRKEICLSMKKEPTTKKCEWCDKYFPTVRNARFCHDTCRSKWHRQKELNENMEVYNRLRRALEYCTKQHPELAAPINEILTSGHLPDAPIDDVHHDASHEK